MFEAILISILFCARSASKNPGVRLYCAVHQLIDCLQFLVIHTKNRHYMFSTSGLRSCFNLRSKAKQTLLLAFFGLTKSKAKQSKVRFSNPIFKAKKSKAKQSKAKQSKNF